MDDLILQLKNAALKTAFPTRSLLSALINLLNFIIIILLPRVGVSIARQVH